MCQLTFTTCVRADFIKTAELRQTLKADHFLLNVFQVMESLFFPSLPLFILGFADDQLQ